MGIAVELLHGWLEGRSHARGLPMPVAEAGGFRVDTASATERCRWVFAAAGPGIADVAAGVAAPDAPIKLCGSVEALRAALSSAWDVEATGHVMRATGMWQAPPLPAGYRVAVDRAGAATHVRILAADGTPAASGHAGETPRGFVYDRIVTDPAHRRRGLATIVMATLASAATDPDAPHLLVATDAGRAVYARLGWEVLSPYATGIRRAVNPAGARVRG